jgi:hypothetical protein
MQNKDGPRGPDRASTGQDLEDHATPEESMEVVQRWGVGAVAREERGRLGFL